MSECHADCEVFNGCAECAEAEVAMSEDYGRGECLMCERHATEIARLRERLDAAVAERGFIARDVLDGRALRKVILDAWSAINNGPVAAYQPPFVRNTRRTLERAVKELKGEAQ